MDTLNINRVSFAVFPNTGFVQHRLQTATDGNTAAEQPGGAVPSVELLDAGEVQRTVDVPGGVCRHLQGGAGQAVTRDVGAPHAAAVEGRCAQGECDRKKGGVIIVSFL